MKLEKLKVSFFEMNPGVEERDNDTQFAFQSHVPSYIKGGFLELSILEKMKVGALTNRKNNNFCQSVNLLFRYAYYRSVRSL